MKDVRLGEDTSVIVSGDNRGQRLIIDGTLDLNGHTLAVQGILGRLQNGITDSYADEICSSSGGLAGLSLTSDVCKVDIARPTIPEGSSEAEAFETVHILFIGYDDGRMVVCVTMSFTSESQLTATLNLKNWPQLLEETYTPCDRIQVFSVSN